MSVLYGASESTNNIEEVIGYAYQLFRANDYIGAYINLISVERLAKKDCQLQNDIAVVLFKLRSLDLSIKRFEQAVALEEDSLLSHNLLDALRDLADENKRLTEKNSTQSLAHAKTGACIICGGELTDFIENYKKCAKCECLVFFGSNDLILAQNSGIDNRNEDKNNAIRIRRIAERVNLKKVVDFGCGSGIFLNSLKQQGIDATGIDLETELSLDDIADGSISAFSMVEVIEHLPDPLSVLEKIVDKLIPGGLIYLETTFSDDCKIFPHPYVSPAIGHVLINSYGSIALLGERLGVSVEFLNRNVVVFRKAEA